MNLRFRHMTDLTALMAWRLEVLREVFGTEPSAAVLRANESYYRRHSADGSHVALVAATETDGDVACGALCLHDELPSPDNPGGRCAYLMNVYVRPAFRHRGVGRELVDRLVGEACRLGCGKIYLETTAAGRALYAACGFGEMKDMMLYGPNH